MEKEKRYRYKTITINDHEPYEWKSYSELEKMLEEWWEIYKSWVNTILKEERGYINWLINNITRFILKKEKKD